MRKRGFKSLSNLNPIMGSNKGNYLEEPPNEVDMGIDEWRDLHYDTQYYHANKSRQKQVRNHANKQEQKLRRKVNRIKSFKGCINCGESEPCVLDFHHTEEDKDKAVSIMVRDSYSLEKVHEEIEKCVVLCANCHRKYHHGLIGL